MLNPSPEDKVYLTIGQVQNIYNLGNNVLFFVGEEVKKARWVYLFSNSHCYLNYDQIKMSLTNSQGNALVLWKGAFFPFQLHSCNEELRYY